MGIKTFVLADGETREFESVEEAVDFLGVSIEGGIASLVQDVADDSSTVFFVDPLGENATPEQIAAMASAPENHEGSRELCGVAMLHTFSSRDPVLVVNGGEMFLMIVAAADRVEAFLEARFKKKVALRPPPQNQWERWMISVTQHGGVLLDAVGVGPRPETGQA